MNTQRGKIDQDLEATYSLTTVVDGTKPANTLALEFAREYVLGRSHTADLQVDDEKASRRHVKIYFHGPMLMAEDLGSANGTRVNGKGITAPVALRDGDLLEIGRAKYKVAISLPVSTEAATWWFAKKSSVEAATAPAGRSGATEQWMSGSLKTVSLVELLQLLSASMKSAVLVLKHKDANGQIFLREGQIVAATLNGKSSPLPSKNVFRLLCWKEGRFELRPLDKLPAGPEINESTSSLLLEGVQLADELGELESILPAPQTRLALNTPLPVPLRGLKPEELDFIQLVLEHPTWIGVQDHFPGPDSEAARQLVSLLERKIVVAK